MGVNEVASKTSPEPLTMEENDLKKNLLANKTTKRKDVEGKTENREFMKETDDDFYRFMIADFHGIARCKVVTKSAFSYMRKRGPGMAWKTVLLSFDNYFNCDATRVDGVRCTDARSNPAEDLKTPRSLPWAGEGYSVGGVFCETYWGIDGLRQQACPRYMARRLCDQLEQECNLKIYHASEMEFTIFNDEGAPLFDEGCLYIPQQFAFLEKEFLKLSQMCEKAGIPIETLQTEFAPGQIEVVLKPVMGIEGADNEFLFKNAVKEILQKPGQPERATFMSKPLYDKVGNSNHYNHSLWWSRDNGEVEDAMWDETSESGLSKIAEHWLAGILKHAAAMSAITCPTINCWRRLHTEGGTRNIGTPHYVTWGVENRLTMIRVIARGAGKATYFENRVPGSAMNPYLALAAHVAAGMDGIKNKLELPPPGNELNFCGVLPNSLEESLQLLEKDEAFNEYLGQEFINWFVDAKRKEIEIVQQNTDRLKDGFKAEMEFYSKWL